MSSFVVVLDSCVLIPWRLRNCLIRNAASGLYKPYWSEDTLLEVHRHVSQQASISRAQQTIKWLDEAFPDATVRDYQHLLSIMSVDPKDQHVVAATVKRGAQLIVTDNISHFPASGLDLFELEVQSTDTFLCDLLDLDPDIVLANVDAQVAALSRSTREDLLAALQVHAPRFVADVQSRSF